MILRIIIIWAIANSLASQTRLGKLPGNHDDPQSTLLDAPQCRRQRRPDHIDDVSYRRDSDL